MDLPEEPHRLFPQPGTKHFCGYFESLVSMEVKPREGSELANFPWQAREPIPAEIKVLQCGEPADFRRKAREPISDFVRCAPLVNRCGRPPRVILPNSSSLSS